MPSPTRIFCPNRIYPLMEGKFLECGFFVLLCSLMYLQQLEQCLAHSRHSINICLIELSEEGCFSPFFCLSKRFDDLRACRASHHFSLPSPISVNETR